MTNSNVTSPRDCPMQTASTTVGHVSEVLREWMESAAVPAEVRPYVLAELVNRQSCCAANASAS